MRLQVYLVGALVFALLVAVFAVQNSTPVDLRFLFWEFPQISLVLIILGSTAFGALFMLLLGLARQIRTAKRIRVLDCENRKLAAEMHQKEALKNEPAQTPGPAPNQDQ